MTIQVSTDDAVKRYADLVWRIAVLHMGYGPDASDAFQETFIRYFQKGKSFENEEHLKSWLIVVCSNICKDMHKKSARKTITLNSSHEGLAIDQDSVYEVERIEIIDALQTLPCKHRMALYLCAVEGYSAQEVAELMGSKPNTVYSWVSRGRESLKEMLQ